MEGSVLDGGSTLLPRARTAVRAGVAIVVAAALGAGAVPAPASAAASVSFGAGCTLPQASAGYGKMVADSVGHRNVIIGAGDLERAAQIESTASSKSTPTGIRVRQQVKLANAALVAPLPASTSLSVGARASVDRMLRLRFAAVVAADGDTPAQNGSVSLRSAENYLDRIQQETLAWARMGTWGSVAPIKTGQDSLLETAEVATAVAFGYSLVSDRMTASERSYVRSALLGKALQPACAGYTQQIWMVEDTTNWGVVVNSGMAMAATVYADGDEDQAAAILAQAVPRANRAIRVGSADGGSAEGPSYAGLLYRYTAYLSATAQLSFPNTTGLVARIPNAARYTLAMTGTSGQLFNYADANTGRLIPWLALWNARNGGDPLGFWLGQQVFDDSNPDTLNLLWMQSPTTTPADSGEPTKQVFRSSGAAALRSSWAADATYLGVKGGSNASKHSHLDLGSFVLDVNGKRFVGDYGVDNYALPGYLNGKQRYGYWRNSTAGHSTVSVRGKNQPLTASAGLSGILAGSGGARSVKVDLHQALGAKSASRTFTMVGRTVYVRDELVMPRGAHMRGSAQTQASVKVARGGRSAVMTIGSQKVLVKLGGATPGALRVAAAPKAVHGALSNAGWSMLFLDFDTAAGARGYTRTAQVSFTPL